MKLSESVRNKLALLKIADELGSVAKACEIMGYSRDSYYRFKKIYESAGVQGLENQSRSKPVVKNRVSSKLEERVIEIALDYPQYGQAKAAAVLTASGYKISPGGVRSIWLRHNLEKKRDRVLALKSHLRMKNQLTYEATAYIDELVSTTRESAEIESREPGDIWVQDTYELGVFEHIGHLYQHSLVDVFSGLAIAKLSRHRSATASRGFLSDTVIPILKQHELPFHTLITDKGHEFVGEGNPFAQFLNDLGVRHVYVRAFNGPVVNSACAQFNDYVWQQFYEPLFKKTAPKEIKVIEESLANWLENYNSSHKLAGRYTLGRPPIETILRFKNASR